MSWSRQGYEKASYCISQTGRQPAMQSPTAVPRMPASASGVSTQRFAPKRSRSPAVARNTPPARPTSSPITITSGSRSSSTYSASLTASTSVNSATQVLRRIDVRVREHQLRVGGRLRLRGGDACAHQVLGLLARRRDHFVVDQPEPLQEPLVLSDALARAFLLDPLLVDVRARIVGGRVRRGAVVHRLDERRAVAGARPLDGGARGLVDGEHVETVDPHARDAVADRLVGERVGARLRLERRRDRPLVVVADEDGRRVHHGGEVHALVEGALARRNRKSTRLNSSHVSI